MQSADATHTPPFPSITLPAHHRDDLVIASVSGGKDSSALLVALLDARIEFVAVFADTGWEAPETYEHLSTIERVLGVRIERVGVPGGMRRKILERAGFASRMQRWCTRELKVEPLDAFAHALGERHDRAVLQVVGVRANESDARALLPELEHDTRRDVTVWRPLLAWTVEDVLRAHHHARLPMNPLYHRGHDRVGCFPCIFASKGEIRLWAEHAPESVAEVAALERECEALRRERNALEPGRYAHEMASFFQAREAKRDAEGKRVYLPVHVEEVVKWSQTNRGGKQFPLIREAPDGGCFRWGMCEAPGGADE